MNLAKMIAELRAERDRLDQAILALERLSVSNAKRRGRPASWKLLQNGEDGNSLPNATTDGEFTSSN